MKRIISAIIALLCLGGMLAGCAKNPGTQEPADLKALVNGFAQTYSLQGGTVYDSRENPLDEMQIFDLYYKDGQSADFSGVEDYALYLDQSSYEQDTEIGVFRLAEGTEREAFLSYLRARKDSLLAESQRYPFDTAALEGARFGSVGQYVYYVIVRGHQNDVETAIRDALK